jgi:two-component system NtrC family sensor kinase
VRLEVEDNGPGISPEVISSIFDPFFTTKDVGQGSGLGLAITHEIITKHGGSISVESEQNEGTKFIITLPTEKCDLPEAAA